MKLFKRAMSILIDEHAMLRTSFNDVNGIAHQMVHDGVNYDDNVHVIDLRLHELTHAKAVTHKEINKDANRPFELTKLFLLRIKIFILSDHESVFYTNFHHSILDGWSWNNFKRELSCIYNSLIT